MLAWLPLRNPEATEWIKWLFDCRGGVHGPNNWMHCVIQYSSSLHFFRQLSVLQGKRKAAQHEPTVSHMHLQGLWSHIARDFIQ